MDNGRIDALKKEASFLNDVLNDHEMSFFRFESTNKRRAEFYIKAFLEKASLYMQNSELSPFLEKLRKTCFSNGLGESSSKIQRFVTPILKLSDDILSLIGVFLSHEDLYKISVTSKSILARLSDTGKLIRIAKGEPVEHLQLTEKSLLALLRRNDSIKIQQLNLDRVQLTEIGALLELCTKIHTLSANYCDFNSFMPDPLPFHANIQELSLRCAQIDEDGATTISKMLGLTRLDLSCNQVGIEGARAIGTMSNLKKLELSDNQIDEDGATSISKMLGLTHLGLCNNKIGVQGSIAICAMSNLKSLDLSHNQICDEGARAIGTMSNLKSLNLTSAGIGVEGARAISKMVNLESLNLEWNKIGDEGVKAISLMANVKNLDLSRNLIGVIGAQAISMMFGLTRLNLNGNKIGDEGVRAISRMGNVTNLGLRYNAISAAGAGFVGTMASLKSLDLRYNDISFPVWKQLSKDFEARGVFFRCNNN